jgi:hypothetical protein
MTLAKETGKVACATVTNSTQFGRSSSMKTIQSPKLVRWRRSQSTLATPTPNNNQVGILQLQSSPLKDRDLVFQVPSPDGTSYQTIPGPVSNKSRSVNPSPCRSPQLPDIVEVDSSSGPNENNKPAEITSDPLGATLTTSAPLKDTKVVAIVIVTCSGNELYDAAHV